MTEKILRSPGLSVQHGVVHGFTTLELGADYDRLAAELKILGSQIYYVEQTHSAKVVTVDRKTELHELPAADALITDRPDIVIGVRTADCLPILVYDPEKNVVAAIHAGYRGLLDGVIHNTIRLMTEGYGCQAEDLVVAFGPCIRVENYEVGFEVIDAFRKRYGTAFAWQENPGARPHLDVPGSAKMVLADLGVQADNIDDSGLCTFGNPGLFHSYRRAQGAGRQFNFIGLRSPN